MVQPNRIAVFGASGATGQAIGEAALRRGLEVRDLYRPGSEPREPAKGLEVVTGRLASTDDVRRTLTGTEAATCAFGPRIRRDGPAPAPFCAAATANVIAGMRTLEIERLVVQTGAMAAGDDANLGPSYRRMRARYRERFHDLAVDRDAQERVVQESGLDWLLVRPPRIVPGGPTGRLKVAESARIGLLAKARVGDLGELHCDELTRPRFHRQAVYVLG